MAWFQSVRERLRLSLWFIPAILATAAALLALLVVGIDRQLAVRGSVLFFVFSGSPEGARSVLSTIAQSMLTFTGLVFTITMLVLQLASSQLSPRVMRTFLRDRGNQVVLGLFIATFVFTLLVLREVRTPVDGGDPFVPAISVWGAFALLLASVGAFVWYIDHMAHAIRASTVIENIWKETAEAIDRRYPERFVNEPRKPVDRTSSPRPPELVIKAPHAGIVTSVDEGRLLAAADAHTRMLRVIPMIGEFLPSGAPLAVARGTWDRPAADEVRGAIAIGGERTLEHDPAFGFRQLVDVAVRALSPGTNDPTTAVQALDRLHDLLRRLVLRQFPPFVHEVDGRVRLIVPRVTWQEYLRLAIDEIRLSGESQLHVMRRLRALLEDLATLAPPERLPAVRAQLAELDAGVERGFSSERDRQVALTSGRNGRSADGVPRAIRRLGASQD